MFRSSGRHFKPPIKLPTMLRLYDHPLSPYAQKVKIALREKGLPFETPMPVSVLFETRSRQDALVDRAKSPMTLLRVRCHFYVFLRAERAGFVTASEARGLGPQRRLFQPRNFSSGQLRSSPILSFASNEKIVTSLIVFCRSMLSGLEIYRTFPDFMVSTLAVINLHFSFFRKASELAEPAANSPMPTHGQRYPR